jgi:hypothetical protein
VRTLPALHRHSPSLVSLILHDNDTQLEGCCLATTITGRVRRNETTQQLHFELKFKGKSIRSTE